MSHVPWNPAWETGNDEIDRQHKELLDRMEVLLMSLLNGREEAEAGETLRHLASYIDIHFGTEETLMERTGYDRLDIHRAAHENMRGQVKALAEAFEKAPREAPVQILNFLTEWLRQHLSSEDQLMADHLRGIAG